jgi:hypothetical protein
MTKQTLSPGPWRIVDHEYFTAIFDRDGNKLGEIYTPRRPTIVRPTAQERALRLANAQAMADAWSLKQGVMI